MRLTAHRDCDVLVVGAGIAGLRAALAAAGAGRQVVLASAGATFSGSSFYPGTWGLGLIGPENQADEGDLAAAILDVGRGMADPRLVSSFVSGIAPAVEELQAMGVRLKEAGDQNQREFIPCFDHKHRSWHGLLFSSLREVLTARLTQLGVELLPGVQLLELTRDGSRVDGAVLGGGGRLLWIRSGAVVLSCGGLGGLYHHRLTTGDVTSSAHWLALEAGAELVNLEFLQMMPGYVSPCPKTIFNEKTFRWVRLSDEAGRDILEGLPNAQALLEQRSGHGPFTSRLADRAVDLAILRHQGETGVTARYRPEMKEDTPEFVQTYFDWLSREKGLTMDDPVHIGIFAHASNGGIVIDCQGRTGVPGLYAAGEITGGMHGADRIGGLSTANGLVFGARAGRAAASALPAASGRAWVEFEPWQIPDAPALQGEMRRLMTRHALVLRSQEGLEEALSRLSTLSRRPRLHTGGEPADCIQSRTAAAQLGTARCVLTAQLLRRESRGSHFRQDFPQEDPALARPIRVRLSKGLPWAEYEPVRPPEGGLTDPITR